MTINNQESSDNSLDADIDAGRTIVLVPEKNDEMLSNKERVDYRSYRESFLQWLLHLGKEPDSAEGYSPYTVYESGYRAAAFDRWVWDQSGDYRIPPDTEDADAYLEEVAYSDRSQATKGKIEEMLRRYYRWLEHKYGADEWDPAYTFESSGGGAPRDFLTVQERRKIRQAALDHGSIPAYNYLSAEKRGEWKSYVARVLDTEDPSPEDWEKVDGWKITSMVWTSLDAGLRPIEVGRATTKWVDLNNNVLRIPREESSKNQENWTVSVTERTSTALEKWMDERKNYNRYEGTDQLWLTTHGNPYGSKSLSRLLKRLCGEAGIPLGIDSSTTRGTLGKPHTRWKELASAAAIHLDPAH